MNITGKSFHVEYNGINLRYLNQRCRDWTHPYEYPPHPGGTLTSAGCGIFSACFAIQKISGQEVNVEALADFSCANGGRGDDGTDRPMLLKAMKEKGLLEKYGIRYDGEGHVNDHDKLWDTLSEGGCALCNLRVGHIVCLIGCRIKDGERQVLAIDSHSESGDKRIADHVREIVESSEVIAPVKNEAGLLTGYVVNYGIFWVPLALARDFNLLHPLSK